MPSAPTVSVALCTYNGAAHVETQLRSILSQTHPVKQVVVSDDGSSDDTLATIERVWLESGTSAELTILRNPAPLGVTQNFAQAAQACMGDIIVLSDQDDRWHSERVAAALQHFAENPDLDLLHSDARLVDADGNDLGLTLFAALEMSPDVLRRERYGEAFAVLLQRNLVTGATTAFRRRLLARALPFPAEWVHDEWLAIIAAATGRVDWLPATLIDYRQHGENQIGVSAPTLGYKVKRMLQPRAERNRDLERRSAALLERLASLGVDPSVLALAKAKHAFERARALLPDSRPRRLAAVLALARTGGYQRFASQGTLDIARDLLQPA